MRVSISGVTLTELIIATLIISVMLVGISSTDYAIRKLDRDTHHDTALYQKTQALAEHIRQAALKMIGDSSNSGYATLALALDNNNNYLCFRYDADGNGLMPPDAGDLWRCFTRLNSGAGVRTDVYACDLAAAGACTTATGRFVGTVTTDVFATNPPTFSNGLFSFQLVNRVNPALSADVNTNPEVTIRQDVYIESHSNF